MLGNDLHHYSIEQWRLLESNKNNIKPFGIKSTQ